MGHLMAALTAFLLVGFFGYLFAIVALAEAPGWWLLGLAGAAALASLAISTRGFAALRPPPGSMPGSTPPRG